MTADYIAWADRERDKISHGHRPRFPSLVRYRIDWEDRMLTPDPTAHYVHLEGVRTASGTVQDRLDRLAETLTEPSDRQGRLLRELQQALDVLHALDKDLDR